MLLTYTRTFNHFKFQIFNHFTFEVFILGNVFTKGIIFIQSMKRDKIGENIQKKFKTIKHKKKKTRKLIIVMIGITIMPMIILGFGL